jgi:hypothetical protein
MYDDILKLNSKKFKRLLEAKKKSRWQNVPMDINRIDESLSRTLVHMRSPELDKPKK